MRATGSIHSTLPLTTVILCTKFISLNNILWMWQQSCQARLQYQHPQQHVDGRYDDILIFTQFIACKDRRTGGRTDSHPDFNSPHHRLIIYIYITLYLSRLVLGEQNYYILQQNIFYCTKEPKLRIRIWIFISLVIFNSTTKSSKQ